MVSSPAVVGELAWMPSIVVSSPAVVGELAWGALLSIVPRVHDFISAASTNEPTSLLTSRLHY